MHTFQFSSEFENKHDWQILFCEFSFSGVCELSLRPMGKNDHYIKSKSATRILQVLQRFTSATSCSGATPCHDE